jgi:hypothetical protein
MTNYSKESQDLYTTTVVVSLSSSSNLNYFAVYAVSTTKKANGHDYTEFPTNIGEISKIKGSVLLTQTKPNQT